MSVSIWEGLKAQGVLDRMDLIGDGIHEIARGVGAYGEPTSWKAMQAAVRSGSVSRYVAAGDQMNVSESGIVTVETSGDGVTSAAVTKDAFIDRVGNVQGTYEFDYKGAAWQYNGSAVTLADYGVTASGTPKEGDAVVVRYTATNAVYDAEGINEECPVNPFLDNCLSLIRHDCLGLLQFDPPQHLFAVTAEACEAFGWPSTGMPAGTYNIKLHYGAYSGTAEDGTYKFTTTKIVPVGGGIRHSYMGTYQSSASAYAKANVLAGTFTTYDKDGLTEIETGLATTEGSTGTNLGTATGLDPQYKDGDYINFTQRQKYGSNRWSTSFIRQVLNSKDEALKFVPGTIWSRPVDGTIEGYMHSLDPDLVAVLGPVRKRYALSIADGYGYEDVEDTVTLATMLDVFGSNNNSIAEGPVDSSGNVTRTTAKSLWKGVYTEDADRIKRLSGTARHWWLSSAYPSSASSVRSVHTSGALNHSGAHNSYGVVPVLHII